MKSIYDNGVQFFPTSDADWTDLATAMDLNKDIEKECEKYDPATDVYRYASCISDDYKGCNWSMLYAFCGSTMLLVSLNSLC